MAAKIPVIGKLLVGDIEKAAEVEAEAEAEAVAEAAETAETAETAEDRQPQLDSLGGGVIGQDRQWAGGWVGESEDRQPELDSLGGGVLGQDRQAAEVAGAVAQALVAPVFDILNTLSQSTYSDDNTICFWNDWKVSASRKIWVHMYVAQKAAVVVTRQCVKSHTSIKLI